MTGLARGSRDAAARPSRRGDATWLNTVEVGTLAVGSRRLSLLFRRAGEIPPFSVTSRERDVTVVVEE